MKLLLLSNSTNHGHGYLEHALPAVLAFFSGAKKIGFVPFALADHAAYIAKVHAALLPHGLLIMGLTRERGTRLLEEVDGVFVGGGNTFRLLDALQETGLGEALRDRCSKGLPYMGASAGTNVATPSLRTTNDMPIVQPKSFAALSLVPFQVNPHYLDPDAGSRHMGETREERLREFHEENAQPVVGLREGSWLRVDGARLWLEGGKQARLFRQGQPPVELDPGPHDELLGT